MPVSNGSTVKRRFLDLNRITADKLQRGPLRIEFPVLIFTLIFFLTTGCTDKKRKSLAESPSGMVMIPSGTFTMGGNSRQSSRDEFPRRKVRVDAFYMDVHEVTNRQFSEFVESTGYLTVAEREIDWEDLKKSVPPGTPKPPKEVLQPGSVVFTSTDGPVSLNDERQWWEWKTGANWREPLGPESNIEDLMDHPVVHVAWEDAVVYAEWAKKRLPTEAEWEWAARGGLDDPVYPWGNEPANTSAEKANFWQGQFPYKNTLKDGYLESAPVKSYSPNGYGLYDMAGNVWEWCADLYHHEGYSMETAEVCINPKGPEVSFDPREPMATKRVIRGGSFLCNDSYCSGYRVSRRMSSSEDTGLNHTGFRCVRSANRANSVYN